MSRSATMFVMAILELFALTYFALVIWHAEALALVLMRRGYEQRGWTVERLTSRVRFFGVLGAVAALAAVGVAVSKALG